MAVHNLLTGVHTAASGNGLAITVGSASYAVFEMDLTNADTDAGDILKLYVQTKIQDKWVDIVYFEHVIGTDSAVQKYMLVVPLLGQASFKSSTAMTEDTVRHILGGQLRGRWEITEAGTLGAASFTFDLNVRLVA